MIVTVTSVVTMTSVVTVTLTNLLLLLSLSFFFGYFMKIDPANILPA